MKQTYFVTAALALATWSSAQVSQPSEPATARGELADAVPAYLLNAPDAGDWLLERADSKSFALEYGEALEVQFNSETSGVWNVSDRGELIWRLELSSPGAFSLGVQFTDFWLPRGSELFLYSPDKSTVLGAYTHLNNNVNNVLGVEPLQGDTVVIEYVQQAWVDTNARLTVGEVVHDYLDVLDILNPNGGGGLAGTNCNLIGINCPAGSPYQLIKRSVVRTLSNGTLCSGSLVNNTGQTGEPYLYTANHCGQGVGAVLSFNLETAGCGVGNGTGQTVSGVQLLAASGQYDSRLYRLTSGIPSSFGAYYTGWNRTTSLAAPAFSIGHGLGQTKQIAIDANGASSFFSFWTADWTTGDIESGHSGGPLFDGNQRVIGPLCCANDCQFNQQADYGKLSGFYNAGGLAQWLDPAGSGQTTTNGFDPSNPGFAPTLLSANPAQMQVFQGGVLTITGENLQSVTGVSIDGVPLTEGLGNGNYQIIDWQTIEILNPNAPSVGVTAITVTNSSGQSNGVFVDFTPIAAPILNCPVLTFPSLPFTWSYAGAPNDTYILNFQLNNTTVPFAGFDILASPGQLFIGSLNGGGTGSNTIPSAPSLGVITVWFQLLTFDPVGGTFTGASSLVDVVVL